MDLRQGIGLLLRTSIRRLETLSTAPDAPGTLRAELLQESAYLRAVLERLAGPEAATTAQGSLLADQLARRPRLAVPEGESPWRGKPTFLVGSPRGGSTLLSWMLDTHPSIAAGMESGLVEMVLLARDASGELLLERTRRAARVVDEGVAPMMARFGAVVDGMLTDYAQRRGKRRWIDKTIATRALDLLDAVFDYRARFIVLVRHGIDVAVSAAEHTQVLDVDEHGSLVLRQRLAEWCARTGDCLDFAELNPARVLVVRYEDLVVEPEAQLRRLLAFLDEPWHPTLLDDMWRQEHPPAGDRKIHFAGARVDASRAGRHRSLPPSLLAQLGRLADPVLVRAGYSPVGT